MKIIEHIDVVDVSSIYNFSMMFMVFALLPDSWVPQTDPVLARPKSHPLSKISIKVLGDMNGMECHYRSL